ncbi:SafA/ExsA family spore coat assembly protein [Mesobacillus maritimus]|uniref:SafA/ExsA family spore coat assembly protein n=1 Tax=Mesobacillus maritimus TaxID=1643336 RepID=UPI002042394B|nr:SafA/ExsA family spore coat assembly protein [Mesobacillus maritimus]MCM3585513.1 SafA/ExsA family spore coat assembly protein [Mesobacillus maritimus]MCM3669773.1 SafA/ExsA family spore coat assembly protein [Mesobacillus maritimus]
MLKKILLSLVLLVTVPTVSSAQQVHTVSPGDTMWKISVWYKVGLSEIIGANTHIKNPALIYPGQRITIPSITEKSIENQVIQLTNQERAKHGLKPLTADWQVSRVARHKSADMRDKNYFQHNSPTYGTPFNMLKSFGVSYRSAGENIAAGQPTAQAVVKAWMESPGHRANILNSSYTHIGVGHASGGSYGNYWTQMFISK